MQKVDETINALCDWIQRSLKDVNAVQEGCVLPDMVKALAELVSARRVGLSQIKTYELVEELKLREGVITEYAEPYKDKEVVVNGPAYILIVTD